MAILDQQFLYMQNFNNIVNNLDTFSSLKYKMKNLKSFTEAKDFIQNELKINLNSNIIEKKEIDNVLYQIEYQHNSFIELTIDTDSELFCKRWFY